MYTGTVYTRERLYIHLHLEAALFIMTSPFANNFDPTTSDGRKLWNMATHPVTNPYDGSANKDNKLLEDVMDHALLCLWMPLLMFSVTNGTGATATTTDYNLLENYTLIPLAIMTAQTGSVLSGKALKLFGLRLLTQWQQPQLSKPFWFNIRPTKPLYK